MIINEEINERVFNNKYFMMQKKTVSIIGWGIWGLATAILMAKDGHQVSVYEKNECLGWRASIFSEKWYTFDMWPSWYLMPDLFEKFFNEIWENIDDHLDLQQLSPSYKVFYPEENKNQSNVIILHGRQDDANEERRKWLGEECKKNNIPCYQPQCNHKDNLSLEEDLSDIINQIGEYINENTIIVGYRLWWLTAKHLITKLNQPIKALITVASTFSRLLEWDDQDTQMLQKYFNTPLDYQLCNSLIRKHIALFSKDDPVIIYDKVITHWNDNYPNCELITFSDKGHFNSRFNVNTIPELWSIIIKLIQPLNSINVYADIDRMANQFENMETWSGQKFRDFLKTSGEQYSIWMEFALRNYDSIMDFFRRDVAIKGMKLNIITTIDKYVARFFKTSIIQKIMQYTTVFLGTAPSQTPAFYNIMSHVDFAMGVRYPQGWLNAIATVLVNIGKKYWVQYYTNSEISSVYTEEGEIINMTLKNWKEITSDIFIVNADQARFETEMLPLKLQTYTKNFWDKKTFAPSWFIIYAGINKELKKLEHHNLYFNDNRADSFGAIYDRHVLSDDPSIYICAPWKTDPNVAPKWKENLFILVPITNGINISEDEKKSYRDKIRKIVEEMTGEDLIDNIEYERIFEIQDFKQRYNARKGTALWLGHTIMQTASFRPNNYSKKLSNLFYVGHNTNPGIGVPMVIVSAMLVKERIYKKLWINESL
jgi:phytoene desaturase